MLETLAQQAPDDWLLVTNVAWSRRGPADDWKYVRDGEADIVVLAPGYGMAVLEVKGSRAFRIGDDGRWLRQGESGVEEIIRSPAMQACANMHELADLVVARGTWDRFPGGFAYMVVYPQGRLASQPPTTHDSSTLTTCEQIKELASRVRNALELRATPAIRKVFDDRVARDVSRLLTSQPFVIVKADSPPDVQGDATGIEALTRQQFAALRGVFNLPRVSVIGPAGSGKTVIAMWRLEALVSAGRRAMYVCFNKSLAASLRRRHPELGPYIAHVDKLLWDIAQQEGVLPAQTGIMRDRDAFFSEELPGKVFDMVATWPDSRRYDALIVDEGQDINDSRAIAIMELLCRGEDASFTIFSDKRQDIFGRSGSADAYAEVQFRLYHNCRNTLRINERTNVLLGGIVPPMPGVPVGVDPVVRHCSDARTMAAQAWQLASSWSGEGNSVAILSPYSLANSCMKDHEKGHGLRLSTEIDELGAAGVVQFSTIKSFKGIEATSVILVDGLTPAAGSSFQPEDLYVACTRATARLAILSLSKDAVRYFASEGTSSVGVAG